MAQTRTHSPGLGPAAAQLPHEEDIPAVGIDAREAESTEGEPDRLSHREDLRLDGRQVLGASADECLGFDANVPVRGSIGWAPLGVTWLEGPDG